MLAQHATLARWTCKRNHPYACGRRELQARCTGEGALASNNGPKADTTVADALRAAQDALKEAEVNADNVHRLPSAYEPHPVIQILKAVLRPLLICTLLACALSVWYLSHLGTLSFRLGTAAVGAAALSGIGYLRRSLSVSGAWSAAIIGFVTFSSSYTATALLLGFYFSSSSLTKVAGNMKRSLDGEFKQGGQRDWRQVCCNGLIPTLLALAFAVCSAAVEYPLGAMITPAQPTITLLQGAILGYYACCCGDTWASELGILSPGTPRLITSMRPVRKGTNGAVSLLGIAASAAGGLMIGCLYYLAATMSPTLIQAGFRQVASQQWQVIPVGLAAGLLGSVIDSLLGATLQYSGFDPASQKVVSRPAEGVLQISGRPLLSNNAVNLCSASLTAALTALFTVNLFL